MGLINLVPVRVIFLVVLLLIALFVLPEGIISKVPYAQITKSYLEETFSRMLNTFNELSQNLLTWIDDTALTVRDEFDETQMRAQFFVKGKMEAIEDIVQAVDAINRLLGRTSSVTE